MWLLFKTIEVVQGRSAPKVSLADRIARSARAAPAHLRRQAARRSGASSTTAPAATAPSSGTCRRPRHTAALKQYPEAYERRVSAFFAEHLDR